MNRREFIANGSMGIAGILTSQTATAYPIHSLLAGRVYSSPSTDGPYWGLTIIAEQSNCSISFTPVGSAPTDVSLAYSIDDGISWTSNNIGDTISLQEPGDKIYFAAPDGITNTTFGSDWNKHWHFVVSGKFRVEGDVTSLLNKNKTIAHSISPAAGAFIGLFKNCSSLISAMDLVLPFMSLSAKCYMHFFYGCSSLLDMPLLPATTLAVQAYDSMFRGCSALLATSPLPAVNISNNISDCFSYMFYDCKKLQSLIYKSSAWRDAMNHIITRDWVRGVFSAGTFYCPAVLGTNETISRGTSACPSGWTVMNIN